MSHSPNEWEVTQVPEIFRNALVHSFHVELLDNGSMAHSAELHKNHPQIRLAFQSHFGDIKGARISMSTGDDFPDDPRGVLLVKMLKYDNDSNRKIVSLQMPIRPQLRLSHLLWIATDNRMHYFNFTMVGNEKGMGCRDFITQFCHQVQVYQNLQFLTSPGGRYTGQPVTLYHGQQAVLNQGISHGLVASLNYFLAHRYSPGGHDSIRMDPSPIDRGRFTMGYDRVENPDMYYRNLTMS